MKKLLLVFALLLCGCSANNSTPKKDNPTEQKKELSESTVTLEPGKGKVKSISMNEIFKMMDNDETFVVMLSQTYCNACLKFFMETDAYTEEIGITLWDIVLDDEPTSESENLKLINEKFNHFSATPSIYYIQDGEVVDSFCSDSEEPSLENYKNFLKENKIIK